RARQDALVGADVLELAVDHIPHDRAGGVLALALDVHAPRVGVELGLFDRHSFRSGIDRSGDRLAVPVQLEQDARAIVFGRSPIAAPRAFQRVAELRQRRRGEQQRDERNAEAAETAEKTYRGISQRPHHATDGDLHRRFSFGRPTLYRLELICHLTLGFALAGAAI